MVYQHLLQSGRETHCACVEISRWLHNIRDLASLRKKYEEIWRLYRYNDNNCDYRDTCVFFISPIIKEGDMITLFGGYACGWLEITILCEELYKAFTPNLLFSDGRNRKRTIITVIVHIVSSYYVHRYFYVQLFRTWWVELDLCVRIRIVIGSGTI